MNNITEFKPRAEGTITLTNAEALILFKGANVVRGVIESLQADMSTESDFEAFVEIGLKVHDHLGNVGLLTCCKHHPKEQ